MSAIEQRARELIKAECPELREEAFEYGSMMTVINLHVVMRALRAALTPPEGSVLVPVEPTEAMIAAAEEAHMPFGDMGFAILVALAARPEVP